MALIKFSNDSKAKIFSKTTFSSSGGGGGVVEPDIFWSGWSSEPSSYFDDPNGFVGIVTSDGVSNLLISDRTALTLFGNNNGLGGSVDASNCINLTQLYLGNSNLTSVNISNCPNLNTLSLQGNQLTQENIEIIIGQLFDSNVETGFASFVGPNNASISEFIYDVYVVPLRQRGWTVYVKKESSFVGSSGDGGVGLNLL